MAYQARRQKRFTETFELLNEDDEVVQTLFVDLDADSIVSKLNRKYADLTRALADTTRAKRDAQNNEEIAAAFETLGKATVDLFEAVFGQEDTKVITDFYDGNYIEMVKEVTPFITKHVIPRCIEIKNENQGEILKSYNRKQRRAFMRLKK